MLNLFLFHLISSHRSFSWKLFTASHCHRSLCHPISPHHLNSSQLIQCLLSFFHLISSNPISCLLSLSQLFSADHNCSHRFSCHLSFSHLFSSHLGFSQLFSDFHSSSQLFSALRSSCQLILCLLISSLLFSHLLSFFHISSADLRSCQLVSPHLSSSQRTLKPSHLFSRRKPAPKTDLDAKASNPYAFHREDFRQKTFTHSKLLHREAWTHRSLYTELGKLFFTAKQSHTARFHTENLLHAEAFAHSKLLHTANFYTQHNFHTKQSCTHTATFYTQQSFYTQQTFTHSKLSRTQRIFYTQNLLHTEAKHFKTHATLASSQPCSQRHRSASALSRSRKLRFTQRSSEQQTGSMFTNRGAILIIHTENALGLQCNTDLSP